MLLVSRANAWFLCIHYITKTHYTKSFERFFFGFFLPCVLVICICHYTVYSCFVFLKRKYTNETRKSDKENLRKLFSKSIHICYIIHKYTIHIHIPTLYTQIFILIRICILYKKRMLKKMCID